MEKVFEIVGSLIPDEQKDDIKSKIDGAVNELVKEREIELKKTLSRELGLNLFEKDVEKVFENKNFIRVEKHEELANKYQELETTLNEIKPQYEQLLKDKDYHEVSVKLISEGIKPERLESVKALIPQDGTVDERVAKLKETLPELFVPKAVGVRTTVRAEVPIVDFKTDAEAYFAKRKINK